MDTVDLTEAVWFKSSRSNGQSACVEVAFLNSGIVPVRDSKDPGGPALVFPADAWTTFITAVKTGELLPNT
ncbi:DUF397 domain-containing protein [Streptomyces rubellomurinus]|uniref:DUF397 domain-containing protein n=1 Tax=Streptomyces rubellomurinus (strain ATCC 31215) TaxID=359131 RepID=A0A0F2TB88_STRR3|nr:DUF397 domain-containing protein [Streptomyces rubellomurinus]KJS59600.1 hypothetical protein VM95_26415 [Streptomyces rubellomurinus]